MNNVGLILARQKAHFRARFGADVVLGKRTLRMRTHSLQKHEGEYVPDGPANAAAPDLRVFEATPADFAAGHGSAVMPAPGDALLWQGTSYTITLVRPGDDTYGGVPATLLLFAYRTPPAGQRPQEERQVALWPDAPA